MLRLATLAILVAAPLLPQRALAQDCLCVVGDAFGFGDAFGLVDAPETPDTTIESTAPLATVDASARAPAHRTVLWCANTNDPRCQPMQPTDVPSPRALSGGSVAAALDFALARLSRRFPIEMEHTPSFGLAPSIGVQTSLDRPPRA